MDSFDLNRTSKLRVNNIINTQYGGRFSATEIMQNGRVGAAGMIFYDATLGEGKHVKVTLERLKSGLAIYFRNIDENKLLLFNYNEVNEITLLKEEDILVKKSPSLFTFLKNIGVNYYYARMFLFEHEIINEYKAELTIYPSNFDEIKLYVSRKNPKVIVDFVDCISDKINKRIDLKTYAYM